MQTALNNKELPDIIPQAKVQATADTNILESELSQDQYIIQGHLQRPTFNSSALKELINNLWNPNKLDVNQDLSQNLSEIIDEDDKSLTDEEQIEESQKLFASKCRMLDPLQTISNEIYKLFYNLHENKDSNEFTIQELKTLATENNLILYKFKGNYYISEINEIYSVKNVEINSEGQIISFMINDTIHNIEYTSESIQECSGYQKVKLQKEIERLVLLNNDGINVAVKISKPSNLNDNNIPDITRKELLEEKLTLNSIYKIKNFGENSYYYIVNKDTKYNDLNKEIQNLLSAESVIKVFKVDPNIYKKDSNGTPFKEEDLKQLNESSDNTIEVWQQICNTTIIK